MKHHALQHFRRPPERLNCAQSVLYAYQQVSGHSAIPLSDMQPFGGGRAPDGLCGALYAACAVAPDKAERLKARFVEITGSLLCRQLRKADEHPCEVCVSTSAQLLENELGLTPRGPDGGVGGVSAPRRSGLGGDRQPTGGAAPPGQNCVRTVARVG